MKIIFVFFLIIHRNLIQAQIINFPQEENFNWTEVLSTIADIFDLVNIPNDPVVGNLLVNIIDFLSNVSLGQIIGNITLAPTANVNEECAKQLTMTLDGIIKYDLWGLQMLDAAAKPQSGLWFGNIMHMGNYDECLNISKFINTTKIMGKYCSGILYAEENAVPDPSSLSRDNINYLRLSYGFCIPSACSAEDMNTIFFSLKKLLKINFNLYFDEEFCDYKDKFQPFFAIDIFALAVFGSVALLITLSTLYDIFCQDASKSSYYRNLVLIFSFRSNGRKLFSTRTITPDSIGCLHGIRVLSMMWIIFCHRYMYTLSLPLINLRYLLTFKDLYSTSFILGGNMAVDTFFVISGILVSYVMLCYVEKEGKINWISFYIHRILRLTPALAMMVLFYATLFIRIGSGPFWFLVYYFFQERCQSNWWSTLLFVQNFATPDNMCMGQSWYLAVDTQLYFITPFFLLSFIRWPKKTVAALMIFGTISAIYTFKISYDKELGPGFFGFSDDIFKFVYGSTLTRCFPYLLGLIFGYIIFICKNKTVKIHKIILIVSWIISVATLISVISYHSFLTDLNEKYILEGAFYNSCLRPTWGLAVCVIIFMCATGNGGIVNEFLSCTVFRLLARLTYSMYLVHMAVIVYFVAQTKTPLHFSNALNYHAFWGDLAYTVMISVIWTLAFESPVVHLEKIVLKKVLNSPKSISNGDPRQYGNTNTEPHLGGVCIVAKNT